jgi:hypothetical protein
VNVGLSSSSVSKIEVDNFFEDNQSIVISVINGIGDYEYSIDGISFQDNPFLVFLKEEFILLRFGIKMGVRMKRYRPTLLPIQNLSHQITMDILIFGLLIVWYLK